MAWHRLVILTAVAVVVLAGCSSGPGGGEPVRAAASPAELSDDAVEDLGLERVESGSSWLNRSVQASLSGDVELSADREVRAETHRRVYRGQHESGPVVVAVYSVPAVHIGETADIEVDPAADLSPADLVERVQSVYSVESVEAENDSSVPLLGNRTAVRELSGSGTVDGESVELRGRMATVKHRDDYVTVVVLYPDGTEPDVEAIARGVTHPKNGTA